jgi:hypothetical protein
MAKRTIEETFRAITPKGANASPTLSAGISSVGTGSTGDLAASLSQAGQQIAQLQSAYQQQAALITANTQAVQGNTSAQGGHAGGAAGQLASSFLGGALGFLSPVISGIASLFSGGSSGSTVLPVYTAPPSVAISGALSPAAHSAAASPVYTPPSQAASPQSAQRGDGGSSSSAAPQITVNVSAMDSQSFMDRSNDIANAVREAMLNMHPINNVISNL